MDEEMPTPPQCLQRKSEETVSLRWNDLRSASGASQCGAGGLPERALTPIPVRVREENECN